MDAIHPQRLSRISTLLLASLGVAFAWVLLSLVLGLSATQAHADDDGLLGTVTSTVERTTSSATQVVSDTASAVSDLVGDTAAAVSEPVAPPAPVAPIIDDVVEPVVAPVAETVAPVAAPVAEVAAPVVESVTPIVETVESTVGTVTTDVTEIVDAGVVSPVVDAGVEVVTSLPVAGDAVASTGIDESLSSVGHTVDGVLQGTTAAVIRPVTEIVDTVTDSVGGVVDGTVPAVVTPVLPVTGDLTPLSPGLAPASQLPAVRAPSAPPASASAVTPLDAFARAAVLSGTALWMAVAPSTGAVASSADAAALGGGASNDPISLLRSALQSESSFAGPGGAGPGAWALIALAFVFAYRAWMRRTGLEDDAAPVAPAYTTDVSPD